MTPKYITSCIATLVAALLLTSCLDETPRGQLDEDQAYATHDLLVLNTVATLYNYIGSNQESNGLQGTYRGVYDLNTFTTDEAMIPTRGNDWYDGGFWQNLYFHKWTAADEALLHTWNYLYKVIALTNNSLAMLDSHSALLTSDELAQYKAEVRAMRAMFHFYAMDLYGRVPIVTTVPGQQSTVTQSRRSEVFNFVVNELQEALPYLPNEKSNLEGYYYARLTRPVAHFLLAKLMLNAAVYTDDDWTDGAVPDARNIRISIDSRQLNALEACVYYCNLIEAAGYKLEDDYTANFAVHNETSTENIFTIPMDKMLYANQFLNLFRSRHYVHGSAIGFDAENGSCATVQAVRTYGYGTSQVDPRYALNYYSDTLMVDGNVVTLPQGTPLVYLPLEAKPDLSGSIYEQTAGARMAKYEIDLTAYADGKLQSNDIVLYRYADVLLMRAEALVRNGQSGQADFDLIRSRVGASSREATLDNILAERLMELAWEGWRRNDLVRYNQFHMSYDQRPQLDGESSGYTTVFPIPQTVRSLNPSFQQNPGY